MQRVAYQPPLTEKGDVCNPGREEAAFAAGAPVTLIDRQIDQSLGVRERKVEVLIVDPDTLANSERDG